MPVLFDDALKQIAQACTELVRKYPSIKSMWLYGSSVRNREITNDIDIMVIVDDSMEGFSNAVYDSIENDTEAIRQKLKESGLELHFQSPRTMTLWWDLMRSGEPWAVTSLRDAAIIYDPADFITPLQIMIRKSHGSGTVEKSETMLGKAPMRLASAKKIMLHKVTDEILGSMIDASYAVIMSMGSSPPAAKKIGKTLHEKFVKEGLLEQRYVRDYEEFFEICKKIYDGELTNIKSSDLIKYENNAIGFIEKMEKLFVMIETIKKKKLVETSYEKSLKSFQKFCGKKPRNSKEFISKFEKAMVKRGHASKDYLEMLKKIVKNHDKAERGKSREITEKEAYSSVLYADNIEKLMKSAKSKK